MNRKKELCRNFQRGSCQYGERCKFLHATQQQTKTNQFGFGVQANPQQQQNPNPFGFGVQRGPQTKGESDFNSKYQSQVKPFENKWSRLSSVSNGTSASARQTDTQPQQVNHKCTNSEECKRQIVEDLRNERPLWKLTCYGHCKGQACDINGDISYEELRAAAYEDAKRGLNFQLIVEKERNLLNSKLVEFENLLQRPYVILPNTTSATNPFPISNTMTVSSSFNQQTVPPLVSSFSQFGDSMNVASNRMTPPSNSTFGQPSPLPTANQVAVFGTTGFSKGPAQPFGNTGNSNFQNSNIVPVSTGGNLFSTPVAAPVAVGVGFSKGQTPTHPFGNMGNSNVPISNFVPVSTGSNFFSTPAMAPPNSPILTNNQLSDVFKMSNLNGNGVADLLLNHQLLQEKKVEGPKDASIWLKEQWKRGEIPEEAPPDEFV